MDRVRKENRASQLNVGDSARARERDAESEGEIAWKETETGGVKRNWGRQLKSAPQRAGRGSSEGRSMS